MKAFRILLLASVLGLGAIFGAGQAHAWSSTGSVTTTCSGTIDYWGGYFYYHTYQWADADEDTVSQEHSFSFAGFLEGFENAGWVYADRAYVVYRNGWLDLAVPYQSGWEPKIRDNRYDTDTTDGQWYVLCEL
ncbi:hypothetical protein [Nocardia bhagyanarayanae]|uniref:Uncharacterized protein n=1 Tax=Nocardia bhagyanarayanae TaxID=1215925 RepID=A0A543F8L1_9NOCA|nr:hypothetical protein [Nocardia bhagyanarayanae]TQM30090.1 hypothetical protein FB390_1706 [Nocardia bhagyanarayanae]